MRHGPFEREAKQYGARRGSTVGRRASMAGMTLAATLLLGGCAATPDAVDWMSDTIGGGAAGSQQSVALPARPYLSETPAQTVTPRNRLQCVPYARSMAWST